MLVFGHAGITLGAAALLAGITQRRRFSPGGIISWLTALAGYVDIRVLLLGSLLPDIIDKPVGQVFFRETFSNGRIFSHTLLFLVIVTAAGLYLYKYRQQVWILTIAGGTLMHLVLDEMWRSPHTLFWPFLGFQFEKEYLADWLAGILEALLGNPGIYIPEAIGLAILLWFSVVLLKRRKVGVFIMYGRVR